MEIHPPYMHTKQMKFLLAAFNAKYIHSNPGLYSMRACVPEAEREHVEIAEYTINHQEEDILADLYQRQPDAVGFSCYIWNWTMIQDVLVEFHKLMPQVPIWIGGPEVSYDAAEILQKYPQITGVMIGEGEVTFREVLETYLAGGDPIGLPGTICRNRTGEIVTGQPRPLTDMTTLPFLYGNLEDFTNRIIYYETARGCPYRCSYCLSSIDKQVRLRDLPVVKLELQFFLDHKVHQVKLVDRTFNCNREHALEIWRYLEEHDNGVTNFHFEIAAEILDEEELQVLGRLRPGLAQLEIGVQSTNPRTLQAIQRPMRLERLQQVVSRLHGGHNIHIHLDLIAGLPYEDYESFQNSFNQVYGMHPEQLQLGFLKVLKGSPMHERAEEFGINYTEKPPYEVLYSKWITYAELRRLKKIEEMVEIYYNSNQFVHTLSRLETKFSTPFALYEQLAGFYERNGYFVRTPARSYRYDVLFAFAVEQCPGEEELFRELLLHDMYSRENLKKRPDFSTEERLTPSQRECLRGFFKKEEESPRMLSAYTEYNARQMERMTHVEPLYGKLILFDYRERDPLTGNAREVELPC